MKIIIYAFVFFFLSASCSTDCDKIPSTFKTYSEAISAIKGATFKLKESVNTDKSSWIRGASYYSCDGELGYFILKTDKNEYLYSMVPIEIWNGFKEASSFGTYYNENIKNNYQFKLN